MMTCINLSRVAAAVTVSLSAFLTGCASSPATKGVVAGQLGICPSSPNCVSSYSEDLTHKIPPLRFEGDKDAAKRKLLTVLGAREDTQIQQDNDNYVWATFTTPVMGFVDDGEFLISDDKIDVRSASRVGYSDFGKNRSRMEEIRNTFQPCCN